MGIKHFQLTDQVAVITGGNRGIGYAIAEALADAGAHVVLAARTESQLNDAVSKIEAGGGSTEALVLDVSDVEAGQQAIAAIAEKHGRLDILVNNAGINQREPTLDVLPETYDRILGINLRAPFFLSQAAAKVMKEANRGKIVNIASLTSHFGLTQVASYGTSKGGIVQMTRAMATDWAQYNIQVNAVAPGFIVTDLNRALWDIDVMNDWAVGITPAERLGQPEDVAGAVHFLVSAASDFVTGQMITVDGGITTGRNWPIDQI